MSYWFGFILAFFAVFGLYFLFTLLLGVFLNKNTYPPTVLGDGLSKEDLAAEVQSAKRSAEASSILSGSPIVVFSSVPSPDIADFLSENAIHFAVFL